MGLAVLPARLKSEMAELEDAILTGKDIRKNPNIEKHADWAEEFIPKYDITAENIHGIIQKEISDVFVKVLECAGVYKRTDEGRKAFNRFIETL
jgi:UDPglucose--hexose-1-phosphate uridylyltransferase